MIDEREKLTRDSELYQNTIKTRTINNMEFSSRIVEIVDCRHAYVYNCEIKHRVWDNKNKSIKGISQDNMRRIKKMSPVDRAEYVGKKDNCGDNDDWKAFGSFGVEIEFKLLVELPDGERKELFVREKSDSYDNLERVSYFYNIINSSSDIDITIKEEDKYVIDTGEYSFNAFPKLDDCNLGADFGIKIKNRKKTEKLLAFLSNNNRWVEATLEEPLVENEDEIVVPVSFTSVDDEENKKVMFNLDNPGTNDKLWNLIEELGVGDPRMISGENVYLTHRLVKDEGVIDNTVWFINKEKPKSNTKVSKVVNYAEKLINI